MKFIIDADSPYSLIEIFKKYGHDAVHINDVMGSATDEEILKYANRNKQIIVTKDLGFAYDFLKKRGTGLILIRLPYYFKADEIGKIFDQFIKEIKPEDLTKSITVLEVGKYRIKKV